MLTRRALAGSLLSLSLPGAAHAGCGCTTPAFHPFGVRPLPPDSPLTRQARHLLDMSPAQGPAYGVAEYLAQIPWKFRHQWGANDYANPLIVDLFTDLGLTSEGDTTSWCAAFVNWCLDRVGVQGTRCAWAQSFADWDDAVWTAGDDPGDLTKAAIGDIAVFRQRASPCQGHVAFYNGFPAANTISVLGGNQFVVLNGAKVYSINAKSLGFGPGSIFELLGIRRQS